MDANHIITLSLLIGLLLITLIFIQFRRKSLIMLRALFSGRFFQQLLREGKLTNERIYLYSILLYLFALPCLLFAFFNSYFPEQVEKYGLSAIAFFGVILGIVLILQRTSRLFLSFFSMLFNYQEQKYLYITCKTIYRFYNALLLIATIPIFWYARASEYIIIVYFLFFTIIFFTFFIRFLRNITGISRIHFFIYFCSLEILPYLLIAKLLVNNL